MTPDKIHALGHCADMIPHRPVSCSDCCCLQRMRKPGTSTRTAPSKIVSYRQRPGPRTESIFRIRSRPSTQRHRSWYVDYESILVHILTETKELFDRHDAKSGERERVDALTYDDQSLMGEITSARKKIFDDKRIRYVLTAS